MLRRDEIIAAGISEVVVFHSTDAELRGYEADLPFAVVGDPQKRLYRQFGVESSSRALVNVQFLVSAPRVLAGVIAGALTRRRHLLPVTPTGGHLGLPADFLIAPDGKVLAVKYGQHAYDQWDVDRLLALVRTGLGAG